MSVFDFDTMNSFGRVQSVDTATIIVQVEDAAQLSKLQVNHLIAIRASKVGQTLIGMVNKIMRKFGDEFDLESQDEVVSTDIVKITLIGTLLDRDGERRNVFKRTLESVPEIDSECFIMTDDTLTAFMSVISGADSGIIPCVSGSMRSTMELPHGWTATNCSNVMPSLLEALARENPLRLLPCLKRSPN